MIVNFEKVGFKNFFSYGNVETWFALNEVKNTIITGINGAGKSTILDAICFCLFGRPYRQIKLGQLINSTNNKNMVVQLFFSIGNDKFKIVRGHKPSIFEIWKNDILIEQEGDVSDHQTKLETSILNFNFKTFKQIVVIGKAGYNPFMQLDAAERRGVIEDILDISIFSQMSDIAKKDLSELKSSIEATNYDLRLQKNTIEHKNTLIEELKASKERASTATTVRQTEIKEIIASCTSTVTDTQAKIEQAIKDLEKHSIIEAETQKLGRKSSSIEEQIRSLRSTINFFTQSECPTCHQEISKELTDRITKESMDKIVEHEAALQKVTELHSKFKEKLGTLNSISRSLSEYQAEVRTNESQIKRLTNELLSLSSVTLVDDSRIADESDSLRELVSNLLEKNSSLEKMRVDEEYLKVTITLLKDDGIKAKIIREYVPLMNQLINKYLELFDMFVQFELDETFKESIKSRNRDLFTYNSFSEGEKQKIDLSILFAWREIAMRKNSIMTNLIIFDETMDASLDDSSVDMFINILDSIAEEIHTIVISHRGVSPHIFNRHIHVVKSKDFSTLRISDE